MENTKKTNFMNNSKIIIFTLLAFCAYICISADVTIFCKQKENIPKCKKLLNPYIYDVSEVTYLNITDQKQTKEIEIPVYYGEKYRIVISTEGIPENIGIEIYNDKPGSKNAEKLFSKELKDEKTIYFDPKESKKYYVVYTIPSAKESIKGCAVLMLGFKMKKDNE